MLVILKFMCDAEIVFDSMSHDISYRNKAYMKGISNYLSYYNLDFPSPVRLNLNSYVKSYLLSGNHIACWDHRDRR